MIERNIDIGIGRQCELLGIHRSGLYYAPMPENEDNLHYMSWKNTLRGEIYVVVGLV